MKKILQFLWKLYNFFVLILGHMVVILLLLVYCYKLYLKHTFFWIFMALIILMILFSITANIYSKISKKVNK